MKILILKLFLRCFPFCLMLSSGSGVEPSHDSAPPFKSAEWSFSGPKGTFSPAQLQRGFLVYKEVCASCHSLKQVRYGSLAGEGKTTESIRKSNLGLTMEEVKSLASEFKVKDWDDKGEPIERSARPSDFFVSPYPNVAAARAANNGSAPPDLSTIVKARKGATPYLYSLLTGYRSPPSGVSVGEGRYYNPYFPGTQISMPPPLTTEGQVTYPDGTRPTVDQMAQDVTAFLAWASDPKAEARKALGFKVLFYVVLMTIVFYLAKRRIWTQLKNNHHE